MEEVDTANDIYVSTKGDFELRRRERCVMFKKMTTEELLQEERKRNMELLNKQSELENALLDLAEIVATEGVGEDG